MKCRKLNCGGKSNPCDSYDPTIDPSSMVEFANGVFKFFHINVAEVVYVADASFNVTKIIELKYSYAALDPLKNEFNDYIRGLMRQKQRMYKIVYPDSVSRLIIFNDIFINLLFISICYSIVRNNRYEIILCLLRIVVLSLALMDSLLIHFVAVIMD